MKCFYLKTNWLIFSVDNLFLLRSTILPVMAKTLSENDEFGGILTERIKTKYFFIL